MSAHVDIPCRTCQTPLTPVDTVKGEYRCHQCNKPYQLKNRAPSKALICKQCGVSTNRISEEGGLGAAEWFQCPQCSKKYKRTTSFNYAQIERPRCRLCDGHPLAGFTLCGKCKCETASCGNEVVAGSKWCIECRCSICLLAACQPGYGHCGCKCWVEGCSAQALHGSNYCHVHRCPLCSQAKEAGEVHCQNCGSCRVPGCTNQEAVFAFCHSCFCPCCGQNAKAAGAVHCGCACQYAGCLNPTVEGSRFCSIHRCPRCGNGPKGPQEGHCGCYVEQAEAKTIRYETVWYPPKQKWTHDSWWTNKYQVQAAQKAEWAKERKVTAQPTQMVRSYSSPNFAPRAGGAYASAVGLGPAFSGTQFLHGGTMSPNPARGGHYVQSTHQAVADGHAGLTSQVMVQGPTMMVQGQGPVMMRGHQHN